MAITYIGSSYNQASGTSGTSISLSSLGLQQGDVVVVIYGTGSLSNDTLSVSGFTQISELYGDSSRDINFYTGYKIMGSSPDTSISLSGSSYSSGCVTGIAYCFRGVDASVLDVSATNATGSGTDVVVPPTITPTTQNSIIISTFGTSSTLSGVSSNYNNTITTTVDAVADSTVGCSWKVWSGSGAETATWSGFPGTLSRAWCSTTIALRPGITSNTKFLQFFN